MKNISKIVIALLTSFSLISSATAGELTVTGTAKATYNILSGKSNLGKGIGIANEIDFGAKGELDNGMSWNYQVQLDSGDAASTSSGVFDDSRLELTTSYGTVAAYVSEGGLDTDNSASQSVYARPTDISMGTSGIVEGPGIGDNNLQYHLPSGVLPFETTLKIAYAPSQDGTINSSNATGTKQDIFGNDAQQVQVSMVPYEGVKIGGDYYTETGAGTTVQTVVQQLEAGSIYTTYKAGAYSIGASLTRRAPLILGTSATASTISNASAAGGNADSVRLYEAKKISGAYNVNENLSISYERETGSRELIVQTTENDIRAQAIQAAYTMGGMTLAVSHGNMRNQSYTLDSDVKQTLLAMTMAF